MIRRIEGDGVTLSVVDEGAGEPVVLLHGFPDSSYVWREQIPALVAAGKRVVAPDLRGFGGSDKPQEAEAYRMTHLVADVVAVLDALEIDRADVVGHDWGAGLAWVVAARVPERVHRLVVMSVGHPNAGRRPSVAQREKSWYMLLFQFEGTAEVLLAQNDWKLAREWLRGNGDVDRYLVDLARPGALTAALNWYRANVSPEREVGAPRAFPEVRAQTLGLWSSGDDYLLEEQMVGSAEHVTGGWSYARVDGASHWLQLDAPERVNELLAAFLREERPAGAAAPM
ncbi:MAG TPA: alpha/beta hydrolase [Gaiellaceae bacterium]|nr:alpha/beta hydrolase [Gaiellaceae bacterium]